MSVVFKLSPRQDLPPLRGYKPIPYKRSPAKSCFGGYAMLAGYLSMTAAGLFLYYLNYKQVIKNDIEMRSARLAVYPMLLAERDREFLNQIRRNREAEVELMRDVPGWEIGTYFGERVYKLASCDKLVEPIFHEFYVHANPKAWYDRTYLKLRS